MRWRKSFREREEGSCGCDAFRLEIALELPHKLNPFVTVPLRLVRRIVCFPFA